MSEVSELRKNAEICRKKKENYEAFTLYKKLWKIEKSDWGGYYLAQLLRQFGNYDGAREIIAEIKIIFPDFKRIVNEEMWLEYYQKIKAPENGNYLDDAELLLNKIDDKNKYSVFLHNRIIRTVLERLEHTSRLRILWLYKLDITTLDNQPNVYNGEKYVSELRYFYSSFAFTLIHLQKHFSYLTDFLFNFGFPNYRAHRFIEILKTEIGSHDFSIVILMKYLKLLNDEYVNRKVKPPYIKYKKQQITKVSNIGDFCYCPVSFAINETYNVTSDSFWEKDDWRDDKLYLFHRLQKYKETNNFHSAFRDTDLEISQVESELSEIFNCTLIDHNFAPNKRQPNNTPYYNKDKTLCGKPDYVFENGGKRFIVDEKFSSNKTYSDKPYINDLIKSFAFLFELENLNVDFIYLLYWYTAYTYEEHDGKTRSFKKVVRFKLHRIEKDESNRERLTYVINKLENFKSTQSMPFNKASIDNPQKCLHCSAFSYCNHKTSLFNEIKLPYDLNALQVKNRPDYESL